jgi:hypothetical protein
MFDVFPELVTLRPRVVVEHSPDPNLLTPLVETRNNCSDFTSHPTFSLFEIGAYRGPNGTQLCSELAPAREVSLLTSDTPRRRPHENWLVPCYAATPSP